MPPTIIYWGYLVKKGFILSINCYLSTVLIRNDLNSMWVAPFFEDPRVITPIL